MLSTITRVETVVDIANRAIFCISKSLHYIYNFVTHVEIIYSHFPYRFRFSRGTENVYMVRSSALENSTLSINIVTTMIRKKLKKNKKGSSMLQIGTLKYKSIFSTRHKMKLRFCGMSRVRKIESYSYHQYACYSTSKPPHVFSQTKAFSSISTFSFIRRCYPLQPFAVIIYPYFDKNL